MNRIDETHDPGLRSWVESAQQADTDFPVQNLPLGVFHPGRIGVAIGDRILDLRRCPVPAETAEACASDSLNPLMALPGEHWSALRLWLSRALRSDSPGWKENRNRLSDFLLPMADNEMMLPARIGDYTDFYASLHHATNVGRLFRPDQPLLPNYKYLPVAYHGRASSVVVGGTSIARPNGQAKREGEAPTFGPTQSLDYELEFGIFIGGENRLGDPVSMEAAESRIFGLCLLNDWSARDIQAWEYQPLGPFLAKSFATSISPWIVTLAALAPFRTGAYPRDPSDPKPLPYLDSDSNAESGGIGIALEVLIASQQMRKRRIAPLRLSSGSTRDMYWTMAQMIAHHTSNGCNLRPGDLLGSGTVSGPDKTSRGCLLELTRRGLDPIQLPDGEQRTFLADGDEIILRGHCEHSDFKRIGFGECRGMIVASRPPRI